MAMSPEDHKRIRFQGRTMVAGHLVGLSNSVPVEGMESYATGVLEGVRDFLTAYFSTQTAYKTLQEVADQTGSPLLSGAPSDVPPPAGPTEPAR